MIEIYPNRLESRPIETHKTDVRMTIAEFLNSVMSGGYSCGEKLPLTAWVNDERIPVDEWGLFVFKPSDRVRLHIEPKGADPFTITVALFAGVKAVFGMLMPKLPGTPNTPGQGDSLSEGSARGNKIKLGDPVREIAGRVKVYPDYLLPPRKYFTNYKEQWTELGLCVGVGTLEILADNVKIGDTSLLSLGDDASYRIFQPGESVYGYSAFDWWHTAAEVGSSSTGAAGLELTAITSVTVAPAATLFNFNGYTISIPTGAGTFPDDWDVGLVLRVIAPYTYTVTDGGPGVRDTISGPLSMLNPSPGDAIEVAGENAGLYIVNSYNSGTQEMSLNFVDGSPATQLTIGTGLAAIGPRGLRFRITSKTTSSITVERLTSAGSSDVTFPGFIAGTLAGASVEVDASNYESGWRGPFPACPENEVTSSVELDFFFPEGLCLIGSKGQIIRQTITYEVQYREVGTSAWTSSTRSYSQGTLDQGGVTESFILPGLVRPEFRVRKVSPLSQNTSRRDTIQWYAMRAKLASPLTYPGATLLGAKIRTSDRISAQTESLISVVATRILPNASGTPQPTRSLRDFAAYIPKSLGYPDSRTNFTELNRLGITWNSRGDTFDFSYEKETTAQQALADVFCAGFAELTIDRGQITPVRDEPRTVFEQMYSPQNMVGNLRRTPRLIANPDEFDGVEVTFTNASTWTEDVVSCRLPGDQGLKVEKITAVGVTDKNRAYRIGMRHRRVQRYRPDTFSWATEADALVSRYLSYCAVADDTSGYPQSALMLGFELMPSGAVKLTSSEPLVWEDGYSHGVMIRRPDGSVAETYTATKISDYEISIPSIDFIPDVSWDIDPPHLLFGKLTQMCYPVLITSVSPNGFSSAQVEAVGYDARVYLSDNDLAP